MILFAIAVRCLPQGFFVESGGESAGVCRPSAVSSRQQTYFITETNFSEDSGVLGFELTANRTC